MGWLLVGIILNNLGPSTSLWLLDPLPLYRCVALGFVAPLPVGVFAELSAKVMSSKSWLGSCNKIRFQIRLRSRLESWPLLAAKSLLENRKKKEKKNHKKNPKGGVIFQNSGPPEAAHLLNHYLKIAKTKNRQIINILKEVSFFKTLARRRQHPC